MFVFALLSWWCYLVGAAPFVTTWNTSQANDTIRLPTIHPESDVTIDWGDLTTPTTLLANSPTNTSHAYASAGLYNVSMEGQFRWGGGYGNPTQAKLVDIVSWGGFLVSTSGYLFFGYSNLRVSAPSNTQPVFLPGATLTNMFAYTSFNSSLDWDVANVTDLSRMFSNTPLNQPINFRNTQNVTTIAAMFSGSQFNQPFHFDASGLLLANEMFAGTTAFNQVVNLTNSSKLTTTNSMFGGASSFNQPITFNVDSVTDMSGMFNSASSFNQPINFPATSQLTTTASMFSQAWSFNQPVTLNTSSVTAMGLMFYNASSFASTVNFTSTSLVTGMHMMFSGVVGFDQDLSSWNTPQVRLCSNFCPWCGLPSFSRCVPCSPIYTNNDTNVSVCTNGTRTPAPSRAPSTPAPSAAPTAPTAPTSAAPTSSAPTTMPFSTVSAATVTAHAAGGGAMLVTCFFVL